MRVVIAGIAGAIAMFVWAAVAHLSPLATIGVHTMPNESFVVGVLQTDLRRPGLYIYPSPLGDMRTSRLASKASGILVYTPGGAGGGMGRQLGIEFALELVESLVLALVAAMAATSFGGRVTIAALLGVIAGMATNLSYWNWWGFGLDYTLANTFIELVKFIVAGLVIAAILPRRSV